MDTISKTSNASALPKILIVEDEEILRAAVADILRLNNFLPLEAANGQEGVEVAVPSIPT